MHDWVVSVLPLVGVHEDPEEHVHHVDEDVGAEDALPEIPRVAHLCKEGDEEHGAAVTIHCLVETVERCREACSAAGFAVRRCACVGVDRAGAEIRSEGCFGGYEVRG